MALEITDTTNIQKPVNVFFNDAFLRRAQQMCPYFIGSQPGQLNKQAGTSTIKWRRIEQETPSTSALTELTGNAAYMQGRTPDAPTLSDVVATVAKYGQFYIVNEEVDLFNPNGTTMELVDVLGESAGRSLNQLMRDVLEDNATPRYSGNVASDGLVVTGPSTNDFDRIINELTRNSARMFTPMTTGSQNIGTAPILPSYWALCHPDIAVNISGLNSFKSVETYAGQVATVMGEFGYYANAGRGLRFIMSEDASIDTGAAGGAPDSGVDLRHTSGTYDLYTVVCFGQEAFGSVGLGKRHTDGTYRAGDNTGGWELIQHDRGSGGTSDPFNEIGTIAWKAWFAGASLNSNWSRALRAGAKDLSN